MQKIIDTIKEKDIFVAEVLQQKLDQNNLDAFVKIVSNFIKENCKKYE